VYGSGFIPIIGIMRGTLCPDNAHGVYIATEKIDGNRRIIMNKPTGVEIYTRSGKRDLGLVDIAKQAAMLPVGYVYDCECIAIGDWKDNIECRQESASILNSGGIKTGVKALCFDMLPQAEYDAGISKFAAFARKAMLAGMFGNQASVAVLQSYFNNYDVLHNTHFANSVNAVYGMCRIHEKPDLIMDLPILGIVHSKDEGKALAEPIWQTGGEGVMLVEFLSPYEVNPNPRKTLLKIKASVEYKLKCVNVFEGRNKYEGMLGGITLLYKASNNMYYNVDCGSGFPDYLRDLYWKHPEKIIGKTVEIESFGESRNVNGNYSLNCPIFKRIAGEVD
jgi:ATP-dependent DNA ligase